MASEVKQADAELPAGDVVHEGGCHCGAVRWTLAAPDVLHGIKCNCSVCKKKNNDHCIVKKDRFTLLKGEEELTTYTFNTKQAQHKFCSICGVQSFYVPRSNPNDVAVMPHCIDSDTIRKIIWKTFDGTNWEQEMLSHAPVAK